MNVVILLLNMVREYNNDGEKHLIMIMTKKN